MGYIGNTNKSVSCIYGKFDIEIDKPVPTIIAIKFPEYVNKIDEPIIVEPVEQEIVIQTKKSKEKELKNELSNSTSEQSK